MTIIVLNATTKQPLDPQRAPVDGDLVEETLPGGMKKRYTYLEMLAPSPVPVRLITVRAFLNRFELMERITLRTLAESDPLVNDMLEDLKLASYVNLDDPGILPGLYYLAQLTTDPDPVIAVKVIEFSRIAELTADGTFDEEYTGFR